MTFKTIEEDLVSILKGNEAAKCDDMALYAYYAHEKLSNAKAVLEPGWLCRVFTDRRYRIIHGIASYQSISRIRRKLQEQYEDLRPDQAFKDNRKRVELEYKAYARKGAKNEQ